jgi:RHS repeat-associated protein
MLTLTDPTGFYGYSGTYNLDNRLGSVTTTYNFIPTTSTFVYDGDGGRVKKIDGTTTTRYISKLYECDTTGANTTCSRYIWANDTRVATVATNGTVHYWHGDHLGSFSVITDSTGAKVQALTYYPYGDVRTNVSGTPVNVPYKFTGQELDFSSNLYFYESRYYHAIFGRFISPDTLVGRPGDPQDLNRYAYARNNPLIYTDPTGHFFKKLFKDPFIRALGWIANPMMMQFIDPATSKHTLPVAAGVIGTFTCGPTCGGAASGSVSAFLQGGDIGRGAWVGAASGTVAWAVGGTVSPYIPDSVILPGTAAGAASGATSAALNREPIWQGAIMGAATGAVQAGWRSYFGSQEVNLGQQNNQLLSILGKIGNIPNTVLGLAWVVLGC